MSERAVISVHTKPKTADRLAQLAKATRRSKSYLANEAIERYLHEEEEFINGIKRGLAQADAGEGYSTQEARTIMKQRVFARSRK